VKLITSFLTPSQLKQYLSDYRNDDEKFRRALGELMSRSLWTTVSADTPLASQEEIRKDSGGGT
jgi:hypothetical protein